MKGTLSYGARIIGLAIASFACTAFAQTTANGPYYSTPSWDQTLPAATRFIVLSNMNSEAVLDRETGLVWEKSPDPSFRSWLTARLYCANKTVGARKGWRLPTVDELASLYNTAGAGIFGGLPGSPFVTGRSGFWTSTLFVDNVGSPILDPNVAAAYIVSFTIGLNDGAFPQNTRGDFSAWCVRGGSAGNVQ